MKKNSILSALSALILTAFMAACASDDIAENNTEQPAQKKGTVFIGTNAIKIADNAATRTSIDYKFGESSFKFFWEPGDIVWNFNNWDFLNTDITERTERAIFTSATEYTDNEILISFCGTTSGAPYAVMFRDGQTQSEPNSTAYLGDAGDCGIGKAKRQPDGTYRFTIEHRSAYLCLLPRTPNGLTSTVITKVTITSDNDILGYGSLQADGSLVGPVLAPGQNGKTQVINLGTGGTGFPLNNAVTSQETNAIYAVIFPGTHALTIEYTLKDTQTNVETTVTKNIPSQQYEPNTLTPITANLAVSSIQGEYYRWGAKNSYWYGYEQYQPHNNGEQNNYYPGGPGAGNQMNDRDYDHGSTATPTSPARYDAKADAFGGMQGIPNANELCWYVMKGDPHWVTDRIFAQGGHLVKLNGIWLKKKSAIVDYLKAQEGYPATLTWDQMKEGYQASATASITDFRVSRQSLTGTTSTGNPSNLTDYFFLPAFGFYGWGSLSFLGSSGYFWSSSSDPQIQGSAYSMFINNANVGVANSDCSYGLWVQPFE